MQLQLFDFDGNSLGYSDKVISSYREIKFNDIGSSEFHIEKDDPLVSVISENSYLILEQDGIFQDIVIGSQFEEDFSVHCRSLNWLLSKMIIPPASLSGNIAEIAANLLSSSYGCDIKMGETPSFSSSNTFETNRAQLFSDAIKNCLASEHAGHSVRFSHKDNSFYLDILKGEELGFFVSESDGTLESISLYEDILDNANSVCILKNLPVIDRWNPFGNFPALSNNKASNFGKCYRVSTEKETYNYFDITWKSGDYIYCNTTDGKWKKSSGPPEDFYVYMPDTDVDKKYRWFYLSNCDSETEASLELSTISPNRSFHAAAKNLTFSKDYNIGDFVKLQYTQNNITKTLRCQFTQVAISRDSLENSENPTLEEVI